MKLFLSLLYCLKLFAAVDNYSSQMNLAPITALIEQNVGASLFISDSGGSSLIGASVISVVPQVWISGTGSSVTSFAFDKPALGPGQNVFVGGQTNIGGGSLTLAPMSFKFHAPSIYPQYGNSLQIGTQTYSVSAQIQLSNGSLLFATAGTVKVNPLPLPDSQISGWH